MPEGVGGADQGRDEEGLSRAGTGTSHSSGADQGRDEEGLSGAGTGTSHLSGRHMMLLLAVTVPLAKTGQPWGRLPDTGPPMGSWEWMVEGLCDR